MASSCGCVPMLSIAIATGPVAVARASVSMLKANSNVSASMVSVPSGISTATLSVRSTFHVPS